MYCVTRIAWDQKPRIHLHSRADAAVLPEKRDEEGRESRAEAGEVVAGEGCDGVHWLVGGSSSEVVTVALMARRRRRRSGGG